MAAGMSQSACLHRQAQLDITSTSLLSSASTPDVYINQNPGRIAVNHTRNAVPVSRIYKLCAAFPHPGYGIGRHRDSALSGLALSSIQVSENAWGCFSCGMSSMFSGADLRMTVVSCGGSKPRITQSPAHTRVQKWSCAVQIIWYGIYTTQLVLCIYCTVYCTLSTVKECCIVF